VSEQSLSIDHDIGAISAGLSDLLGSWGRVAVAFSGGVDSAVVAQAARIGCGEQAVAITAVSPSLAQGELEQARELAERIGIRHVVLATEEFADDNYLRNASNRCFYCKTELYTRILREQEALGFDVIANGANADDLGDHRPGMQAAQVHAVRSPLIELGLRKDAVRDLARYWNLPVWDKPAAPCLSSRIAYGVAVTPERVARIDQAEAFLRELLSTRELRVRLEANELARIEVPIASLPAVHAHREEIVARLKSLGFRYISLDLDGFRSGSMNAVLQLSLPHDA
jgi:uncharacterized protein